MLRGGDGRREGERENPLLSSFSERFVEKELDFLSNSFPCWLVDTGMWEHQSLHDVDIPYSITVCQFMSITPQASCIIHSYPESLTVKPYWCSANVCLMVNG